MVSNLKSPRRQIFSHQPDEGSRSFLRRKQRVVGPTTDVTSSARSVNEATPLLAASMATNSSDEDEEEQRQNSSSMSNGKDDTTTSIDMEYVERLEADVQRLAEKCASLESQNILVAVQQLDLIAQYVPVGLSFSVLYGYWKFMGWVLPLIAMNYLPNCLEYFVETGKVDESYVPIILQFVQTNVWAMKCLQVILLSIPYLYNRWTYGSMHRRFQVFVIFFIILIRIRMCRWREKMFLQEDTPATKNNIQNNSNNNAPGTTIPRYGEACTNDGIWEANYEISARFLYLSILRLRGLWTKTAQYLSSRSDFVPVSYIRELSKLQDQAPATPWDQVERLLSKKLLKQLTGFEKEPIASASIGQVHVAKLGDRKVVVKVQHPHARTLMTDDFRSLKILTRIIGWLEPEYVFIEILMNEWAQEAVKELDFTHESAHLREAMNASRQWMPTPSSVMYTNIHRTPFQVEIPEPIEELSSRQVLVMNFCEGCRVDDFNKMEGSWGLSRLAVIDGVAQVFAYFMYCSTILNGDPHAGNILVRRGIQTSDVEGFTIVVLDWGLAKRLPESKRLAFCQMAYAAATIDYGLLLDSFKTVGLKMKREDSGQAMENTRFFLRDMAPRDVARKKIKAKIKHDEALQKKRNEKVPMESRAYPGEFFFFIRVNELVQGLGSRFNVSLAYLDALRPYAEKGIRMSSHYDIPKESAAILRTNTERDTDLSLKVYDVLKTLEEEKNLVGGQVYIIKDGMTQVDVVAGSLGGLKSHIPMRRDALVLGYSTTKAVTATLAHLMVKMGYLSYDELICERVWKEFCPTAEPPDKLHTHLELSEEDVTLRWQWKRQITLRHLLNHSAGLASAFPMVLTLQKMASCEACYAGFEYNPKAPEQTVLPTNSPGDGNQAYHFMSFGWLVAGTLSGAYATKHRLKVKPTFHQVYEKLLEPKLSEMTRAAGFRPFGGGSGNILAQTVTSDIRASEMIQRQRDREMTGGDEESNQQRQAKMMMQIFKDKEFLVCVFSW